MVSNEIWWCAMVVLSRGLLDDEFERQTRQMPAAR
jgi:hypothetical protein